MAVLAVIMLCACGTSGGLDVSGDIASEVLADVAVEVLSDKGGDIDRIDITDAVDDVPDSDAQVQDNGGSEVELDDAQDDMCQGDTACLYESGVVRLESEAAGVEMELDQWGGWINHPESLGDPDGTGLFRVQKLGGAWWFVTPDGNPMISKGVTDVNWLGATLGDDEFHQILVDKYGDEETWNDSAANRIREWNFNTVGPWSSYGISQRFAHATVILDSANHAPRYSPGDLLTDYFGSDFIQHCDKVAVERATPYVGNPGFIGYWSSPEKVDTFVKPLGQCYRFSGL